MITGFGRFTFCWVSGRVRYFDTVDTFNSYVSVVRGYGIAVVFATPLLAYESVAE